MALFFWNSLVNHKFHISLFCSLQMLMNKLGKIIIISLLLLGFTIHELAAKVRFHSINDVFGMSIREVHSICEDDDGFVWATSKNGIIRITDSECENFRLPYRNTDITWEKITYQNHLYAYASNGEIFCYDKVSAKFIPFMDLRQLLGNGQLNLYDLFEDESGNIWIASSAGLFCYNNLLTSTNENPIIIRRYDDKHLLIAGDDEVKLMNISTLKSDLLFAVKDHIVSLYYGNDNRIWIGTRADGLFYYDIKEKRLQRDPISNFPKQPILAIEQGTDSTLLIGVDGKGLWEISGSGDKVLNVYKEDVNDPASLRGNGVYDIFKDGNSRIWVGTYSGGLSYFDKEAFLMTQIKHRANNYNSLIDNNINRILEDSKGNIWIATNNGISRWNRKSGTWNNYCQDKEGNSSVFLALCEDNEGHIWAGSYSSGISVLDRETGGKINHMISDDKNADVVDKYVLDIYKDSGGDIWIGGAHKQVICYLTNEKRVQSFPLFAASCFCELAAGKLLVASFNNLILLDKKTGQTNTLLTKYVSKDILVLGDDIWVATGGYGVLKYNYKTKENKLFTTKEGLPSDDVNNLIYVDNNLILTTEKGICRLNLKDLAIYSFPYSFYTANNFYFAKSHIVLKDGNILVGSNEGVVMFDPGIVNYNYTPKGRIYIQDINISGRSIINIPGIIKDVPVNEHKILSLKYDQNNLTIKLLPIGVNSVRNKFSWQLEGQDKEWNKPSELSTITYTNVPAGKFRLKIRMYDTSLSQIIDERSLAIIITPPFWETWWFYVIAFVATTFLVVYFVKSYAQRLRQKYARDKIRFFTNIAHDIRTSLTLIKNPIEEVGRDTELSEKSNYYIRIAKEQSEKLAIVASQLLDFQKADAGKENLSAAMTDIVRLIRQQVRLFMPAAQRKGVELSFMTTQESYITAIDELKIIKIVENLLLNAIKYSSERGKVTVALICEPTRWVLSVQDQGIGISQEEIKKLFKEFYRGNNAINSNTIGSGIGLLLIRDYVEMHKGRVSIESKENVGSTFRIDVPYAQVEAQSHAWIENETTFTADSEPEEPANPKPSKANVLIVEDNDDLRNFLRRALQDYYSVSLANDGAEALAQIEKKMPDLVISDVMMPVMEGFELCKRIKSTFETSHIPVILLTALSDKAKHLKGLGLGADDYVTKPFDMEILSQRINTTLKNRESIRDKTLRLIKPDDENVHIFANELNDQFVKKALNVVRENISENEFGRDEFASAMFISPSLLYKKMKALTGKSPSDFIKSIRMNYALELLQTHKYSVTEVCEMAGFSGIVVFSRAFKDYFGKAPTEI